MSRLRRLLEWEVVPERNHKYVYMMAGAVVGGVVYPLTMSWGWAVLYDACTAVGCWGTIEITRLLSR